jgi:hypothetical protein
MDWLNVVVSILSGLAVAIPLVVELIKWVKKAVKEKNWQELLKLVTNLMEEAEAKFDNGNDRREWVLVMVKASADTINYNIDLEQVGKLVDSLCAMSKIVNAPNVEAEAVEKIEA